MRALTVWIRGLLVAACLIAAAALWAPAAQAADGLPNCPRATFAAKDPAWRAWGGTYKISASVRCRSANNVLRRLLAGRSVSHPGSEYAYDDYWQVGPWRCGGHTGTIGCTRGARRILAQLL